MIKRIWFSSDEVPNDLIRITKHQVIHVEEHEDAGYPVQSPHDPAATTGEHETQERHKEREEYEGDRVPHFTSPALLR